MCIRDSFISFQSSQEQSSFSLMTSYTRIYSLRVARASARDRCCPQHIGHGRSHIFTCLCTRLEERSLGRLCAFLADGCSKLGAFLVANLSMFFKVSFVAHDCDGSRRTPWTTQRHIIDPLAYFIK
eukprot:TRINITY_DN30570_c0_g1_i1.p2 TRINITY_DN30570_c0_g1~~TRINITY_DN30570_c0_g1_i1.p2  ORF type:complete len:126 (+),score=9.08 TRINITY_DN30570_c0_g1_i1:73-450(+)